MPAYQEQIKQLYTYLPPLTRREDFFSFWEETKQSGAQVPLDLEQNQIESLFPHNPVFEIAYNGFDKTRIHGILILPGEPENGPYPCMIHYHGFSGDCGRAWQFMHWVALGTAVLSVDIREQGGKSGSEQAYHSGGMVGNVCTKGISDRYEYYYRSVYMDCVRALDAAQGCLQINPKRLFVRGTSQGGGLVMAVCGLDARPRFGIANVPSNSNLEARVEGRHGAFASVNEYLRRYPEEVEQAYETLSYFDTMNLADQISCPIYASVALSDPICPARCYFASYNRIQSEKQIAIYPFNEHDGAAHLHTERELNYIKESGILSAQIKK